MADLTQAMGLNPSSIHAAFGDKHALFSLAVKRYMESRARYAMESLEEPALEKVLGALFAIRLRSSARPAIRPTCMTLAGAVGCNADATPARDIITEKRSRRYSGLVCRHGWRARFHWMQRSRCTVFLQ